MTIQSSRERLRWKDPSYLISRNHDLLRVFDEKLADGPMELRGLTVGLDDAPRILEGKDLIHAKLSGLDLSFGRFSFSFAGARVGCCTFKRVRFDNCAMKASAFRECSFDGSEVLGPILDDATFESCTFREAGFRGRRLREYGGKRCEFLNCDFEGATLENLTLRASRFVNCNLEKAIFRRCLLAYLEFRGSEFDMAQIVDCEVLDRRAPPES
jgi:uncharacterized protein YjbI with pentapeptide repeats